MKYIYLIVILSGLISSCATYTRPENDQSLMEEMSLLNKDKLCFILMAKAEQMSRYFPDSPHRKESEFLKGDCLKVFQPEITYSFWLDFARIYPDYRVQEVSQRISESKALTKNTGYLGFIEISTGRSFSESGNFNAKDSIHYGTITYFRHSEEQDDLGYYISLKWHNYEQTIHEKVYDINATNVALGLSYKKALTKDKLISHFNLAPMITNFKHWKKSDRESGYEGKNHFGINLNTSLDFLIYDRKKAFSGNGKWYLTLGVNADMIRYDLFDKQSTGVITDWFVGIKF